MSGLVTQMSDSYLSKSLYLQGMQCHKALWLHKFRPEVMTDVSTAEPGVIGIGCQVGTLARDLFPGGVLIPYENFTLEEQFARTQEALARGEHTLYEAAFCYDSIFVKVDILHHGSAGWELYEVKSATSLKNEHLYDIAIQYHVLNATGLAIAKACLVHINNQYVRQGDIEVAKLFTILDFTDTVRGMQAETVDNIVSMRNMLMEDIPAIDIGPHCGVPYQCQFHEHCWCHIPENSIFDFRGMGRPDPFTLYQQGILTIEDTPPDQLGWRQKLQRDGLMHRKNSIDVEAIKSFLESLWYPLCFMDFETSYMVPVPLFDGTRPYQQVPFQFSFHILDKPNGGIRHFEFLSDTLKDPRGAFLEQLLAVIPPNACILTWNQTFEEHRLRELADVFTEKGQEVFAVIENLRDLMVPFRNKSLYLWEFNGSYSIKHVLPAMTKGYSYEGMAVNNGEAASCAWLRLIHSSDEQERELFRRNLLQYCHLDTYGMVLIFEEMRRLVTV